MKNNNRKFKHQYLIFFIISGLFFFCHFANAQITYTTQTPDLAGSSITFGTNTRPLGEYIRKVYNYGVGITAILATVVLMIGGFQWIIAGGSGEKIGEAKAWITAALSGLVLALSSYMILNLVNPALVNLKVKEIEFIKEVKSGCCFINTGSGVAKEINSGQCEKLGGKHFPGYIPNNSGDTCIPKESKCFGTEMNSTKGGSDPLISEKGGQCPKKCGAEGVDLSKSFWFGVRKDSYCCACNLPLMGSAKANGNDIINRALVESQGVNINKGNCTSPGQTNCTSLSNMPDAAISLMISIKEKCGKTCDVTVTGGTEAGHKTHGPGNPIFDLSVKDPKVVTYMLSTIELGGKKIDYNRYYTSKDGTYRFMYETGAGVTPHFHVELTKK